MRPNQLRRARVGRGAQRVWNRDTRLVIRSPKCITHGWANLRSENRGSFSGGFVDRDHVFRGKVPIDRHGVLLDLIGSGRSADHT